MRPTCGQGGPWRYRRHIPTPRPHRHEHPPSHSPHPRWFGKSCARFRSQGDRPRATSEMVVYWGDFGSMPPWSGAVAGEWPRGRASVPEDAKGSNMVPRMAVWWSGRPYVRFRSQEGRWSSVRRSGLKQADQPQLSATHGAVPKRACTSVASRALRKPRATASATPACGGGRMSTSDRRKAGGRLLGGAD